jgi:hypothetical protein
MFDPRILAVLGVVLLYLLVAIAYLLVNVKPRRLREEAQCQAFIGEVDALLPEKGLKSCSAGPEYYQYLLWSLAEYYTLNLASLTKADQLHCHQCPACIPMAAKAKEVGGQWRAARQTDEWVRSTYRRLLACNDEITLASRQISGCDEYDRPIVEEVRLKKVIGALGSMHYSQCSSCQEFYSAARMELIADEADTLIDTLDSLRLSP